MSYKSRSAVSPGTSHSFANRLPRVSYRLNSIYVVRVPWKWWEYVRQRGHLARWIGVQIEPLVDISAAAPNGFIFAVKLVRKFRDDRDMSP